MKKILLLNTGGTFSSVKGKDGLAPGIRAEEILALLGPMAQCEIVCEDVVALDSANIMPEDWVMLAQRVDTYYKQVDGIVIIHGTDTMAYTSAMLSFMCMHVPIPVVFTGSQLSVAAPLTDAIDNLRLAVTMAESGKGGVYVAFNRRIILGCRTAKVRTVSFDAFESVNYSQVGTSNAFGLVLDEQALPAQNQAYRFMPSFNNRIAVIKYFPGMDADLFRYLMEKEIAGFFLEGFGLGGVSFIKNSVLDEIEKASMAGIPVLVGSQCRYEGSNLDVYETGKRVLACGGIPVNDMTQEATVTKLMWALGQSPKRADVQQMFQTNYIGEITLL